MSKLHLFFIVLSFLLIGDTLFIITRSSLNFGNCFPGAVGILILIFLYLNHKYSHLNHLFRLINKIIATGFILWLASFILLTAVIGISASKRPEKEPDAIIVLGAGLNGEQVSLSLSYRLNTAATYWKKHPNAVIVVSGGQGPDELCSEAEAMKKYLIQLDIPEDKILEENQSTSTKENFIYSKQVLNQTFPTQSSLNTVFFTNDFHIFRAGLFAKKYYGAAEGLAAPSVPYLMPNFLIREYFACLYAFFFA